MQSSIVSMKRSNEIQASLSHRISSYIPRLLLNSLWGQDSPTLVVFLLPQLAKCWNDTQEPPPHLAVQVPPFDTDFPTTQRETLRTSRASSQDMYIPSKPQRTLEKRRQKECKGQMIGRKTVKSHVLDKTQSPEWELSALQRPTLGLHKTRLIKTQAWTEEDLRRLCPFKLN